MRSFVHPLGSKAAGAQNLAGVQARAVLAFGETKATTLTSNTGDNAIHATSGMQMTGIQIADKTKCA